jgi:potassium-transporting ATPase KdpC subunit
MVTLLRQAILTLLILTGLTGFVYPLAVTGIADLCCSRAASGSLIRHGDRLVGSELIGQPFDGAQYFWPRPSGISPQPYDGRSSGGSNLGPTNSAQFDAVRARIELLRAADPGNTLPIPVDLVTASGSGLDPEISPAAAEYQVRRVAAARGLDPMLVRQLVLRHTRPRQWGILGEPGVNVLTLNLALDAIHDVNR